MKVGDRVMLVGGGYGYHRLHITEDKIKAIHKNGLIVLNGTDQKYRATGTPTGKHGFSSPPRLQAWDDNLWHEYQRQKAKTAMAAKLYRLVEIIQKMHDDEKMAEIWQALPYEIRKLEETDQ